MADILITIGANVGLAIAKIEQLGKTIRTSLGNFSSAVASSTQLNSAFSNLSQTANGFANRLSGAGKSIANFNTIARVGATSARAMGTSMIFAGGAFRDLGVAINVVASTMQAFIPIVSGVIEAFPELLVFLPPLVAALGEFAGGLAGAALAAKAFYQIGEAGIEFNKVMETTQLSIATLITEFKNIYDSSGRQVGAYRELTDAQIKAMSASERDTYQKEQAVAINEKLGASLEIARQAFLTLTVEAAQSPFTTQELANAFKATESVMGRFNITTAETAKLTVTLSRVASVAGVSGQQLATAFTLFLSGAGRITSPLARFAAQIGLSKQEIVKLRTELEAARGDTEKTASIMAVFTTRLAAFDQAGNRMAQTWSGIMSNMLEAFQLFAGSVTTGLFTSIRDAFLSVVPVVDTSGKAIVDIYDKNGQKIESLTDAQGKKIVGAYEVTRTKVTGILSQIFNYDDKGNIATEISSFADVFQKAFQPAIQVIQNIFDYIGNDGASILQAVVDKVIEIATYIGQNPDQIYAMYNGMKAVLASALDVLVVFLKLFGVSSNTDETIRNINSSLTTMAYLLEGVRRVMDLIRIVWNGILVVSDSLGVVIGGIVEAVMQGIQAAYYLLTNNLEGLAKLEAQGIFSRTQQTIDNLKAAWHGVGSAIDDASDAQKNINNLTNIGANSAQQAAEARIRDNAERQDSLEYLKRENLLTDKNLDYQKSINSLVQDEVARRRTLTLLHPEEFKAIRSNLAQQFPGSGAPILDAQAVEKLAEQFPAEKYTTKPGGPPNPAADAKKIREVAEVAKSAFKELSDVYNKGLDILTAQTEQVFTRVQTKLEAAKTDLQNSFERGQISFITLSQKNAELAVEGIKNEVTQLNNEELIRQAHAANDRSDIENSIRLEEINYQQKRKTLLDNKKSQTEINNLDNAHEYERKKFTYELSQLDLKNYAARIQYSTKVEEKEAAIAEAVKKANQEIFLGLKKIAEDTIGVFSSLEEKTGSGFNQQSLNIEVQLRDRLNTIQKDSEAIITRINAEKAKGAAADSDILTVDTDLLNSQKDREDAEIRLANLQKLQLQIAYQQNAVAAQRFDFDNKSEDIQKRVAQGLISEAQGLQETVTQAQAFQEATRGAIQALANYSAYLKQDPKNLKNILDAQQIDDFIKKWGDLTEVVDNAAVEMRKSTRDAFETFFEDIQKNITSVGDAFAKLGQSILATFQKLIAQKLSEQLFDSLFGNADTKKKGLLGDVFGTISQKFGLGPKPQDGTTVTGDAAAGAPTTSNDPNKLGGQVYSSVLGLFNKIQLNKAEIEASAQQYLQAVSGSIESVEQIYERVNAAIAQNVDLVQQLQAQMKGLSTVPDTPTGKATVSGITANGQPVDLNSIGTGSVFMPLLDAEGNEITLVPVDKAKIAAKAALPATQLKLGIGPGGTAAFNPADPTGLKGTVAPDSQAIPVKVVDDNTGLTGTGQGSVVTNTNPIPVYIDAKLSSILAAINGATQSVDDVSTKTSAGVSSGLVPALQGLGSYLSKLFQSIGGFISNLFSGGGGSASVTGFTFGDVQKSTGGTIKGAGTSTSDSIPAMLSNGEFVLRSAAVKRLGIPLLEYINKTGKLPGLANGGQYASLLKSLSKLPKTGPGSAPVHGGNLIAGVKGDLAGAAISIGLALLGRLFAKKQPKSDPNRTKDPYGLNPDTLTFYKKPIISGSRNFLALGGLVQRFATGGFVNNKSLLRSLSFAQGGTVGLDSVGGILSQLESGDLLGASSPVNVRQNINIQTPDIHSFRNARATIERDMSRMAQRGTRRRSPKY